MGMDHMWRRACCGLQFDSRDQNDGPARRRHAVDRHEVGLDTVTEQPKCFGSTFRERCPEHQRRNRVGKCIATWCSERRDVNARCGVITQRQRDGASVQHPSDAPRERATVERINIFTAHKRHRHATLRR